MLHKSHYVLDFYRLYCLSASFMVLQLGGAKVRQFQILHTVALIYQI